MFILIGRVGQGCLMKLFFAFSMYTQAIAGWQNYFHIKQRGAVKLFSNRVAAVKIYWSSFFKSSQASNHFIKGRATDMTMLTLYWQNHSAR